MQSENKLNSKWKQVSFPEPISKYYSCFQLKLTSILLFVNIHFNIEHFSEYKTYLLCCISIFRYVTLEHKISHKGQFLEIEIYASSENWISNLSTDVWFVMIGQYL